MLPGLGLAGTFALQVCGPLLLERQEHRLHDMRADIGD
jgi:hypothetical protein